MYTTIITLHKQGNSRRQIAKLTGHNRKTINRIVRQYVTDGKLSPKSHQRKSMMGEWREDIIKLLEQDLSCIRVHEELQSKSYNYNMSYSALTRYISQLKLSKNICIRFNTRPGEEAQVDFSDIGKRYDKSGVLRKAYVFNMRLSYSRMDYYEVVFDQKVETWIRCHINAFNYFGGVPEIVKLDNLKAAIIEANFYDPIYQKHYKRFADHYNFLPAPCRVRKPQEKGKTEAGVKYVCNNFFAGRSFTNYEEMVIGLQYWLDNKCNIRIHGTTKKRPIDLFKAEEQNLLKTLPLEEFAILSWHKRKVAKDCHITLDNNYYSVPFAYAGSEVEVVLSQELVKIYAEDKSIAVHTKATGSGVFVTNRSHYPNYKLYYPESAEYQDKCIIDMNSIGEHGSKLLLSLQAEQPGWTRTVKGILQLQATYGNEILDKACKRALYYGALNYKKIQEIIKNNCYDLPLPTEGGENASIM